MSRPPGWSWSWGPDVDRWAVGDAVCVLPASSPNEHPLYAEEAVVAASALVARPDGQDPVVAAATWMPYLTVFGMVGEAVRVRPGDRVLVTEAANSIGMAALQMLRHIGAEVVATAGTAHHDALRELGAATVLTAPDPDAVRAGFGGHDADLVLDAVGGPGVHGLERLCRPGGTLIVHGALSGEPTPLPAGTRPVWVRRYHVFEVTRESRGAAPGRALRAGRAGGGNPRPARRPHLRLRRSRADRRGSRLPGVARARTRQAGARRGWRSSMMSDMSEQPSTLPALRRPWKRPMDGRDPREEHRASTPLELLFDLCFVVAVAQAAVQLAHGIEENHTGPAVVGFVAVFFAIWWAWMNFTWFASAYDTDDVPYRVLT